MTTRQLAGFFGALLLVSRPSGSYNGGLAGMLGCFVWKFCSPRLSWLSKFSKLQRIQLSFFNFYDLLWTPPWWTSSSWDFHWNQLDSTCELLFSSESGERHKFSINRGSFSNVNTINVETYQQLQTSVNWVVVSLFDHRYLASTLTLDSSYKNMIWIDTNWALDTLSDTYVWYEMIIGYHCKKLLSGLFYH